MEADIVDEVEVNQKILCEKSDVDGIYQNKISLIYVLSEWADPLARDNRVSVAVLLPSGVAEEIVSCLLPAPVMSQCKFRKDELFA